MDKIKIQLRDFKCFRNNTFLLNQITFLTGSNAAGKSSLIQALQIYNSALKGASNKSNFVDISIKDEVNALDLGNADNLINRNGMDVATISVDENEITFNGADEVKAGVLRLHYSNSDFFDSLKGGDISYLNAERQGPRYETELDENAASDCGCHGDNTASVIYNNQFTKIPAARTLWKETEQNFRVALNKWMSYLFPGITISVSANGATKCQVYVNNENLRVNNVATNVGFGISYVLPILVTCLLAKENQVVIIENPEAHLHAKAQSNMGYFLGCIAATGLRIVVETHSEHIINGIRRAIVCDTDLTPEMVTVYFFDTSDDGISNQEIVIDNEGNMSAYPVDFFDQQRQDSKLIFETVFKNKM